jgi:aldehyde dehydrogenase
MDMLEPGRFGFAVDFKKRYGNYIGGDGSRRRAAVLREHHAGHRQAVLRDPALDAEDVERALDAAHAAKAAWGRTSPPSGAVLNRVADRMEQNLELLATAETWDNGKPIRETMAADLPLAIDHFRYFAGCIRAQEGSIGEVDQDTYAYHLHEPLGVVGQIIPWNFPLLMAVWKLAPALAAGNCVVLKPAEQTPVSILVLMELVGDLLPPGVLNVVNGFGIEAGKPLASSPRIAKIAFTGETSTGRLIMQYASQNIIPVTLELGGKSPNIFFADVHGQGRRLPRQGDRGLRAVRAEPGRGVHLPVARAGAGVDLRAFHRARAEARGRHPAGQPAGQGTMIGAQASNEQLQKILSYLEIGRQEGAQCLAGGERNVLEGDLQGGYYIKPTVFKGHNRMRIFQEEIFGPGGVGDDLQGRGGGAGHRQRHAVRPGRRRVDRDMNTAFRMGRGIQAGRVWTNCYHAYPAHAAFGGYKQSGIGRETTR